MNREDQDFLFDRLYEVFNDSMGNSRIALKTIKALDRLPEARTTEESDVVALIMTDYTSIAIACNLLHHIESHGGEDCVANILERHLRQLQHEVLSILDEGCVSCDLVNPLAKPDHNTQLVKEMLAKCDKDEDT